MSKQKINLSQEDFIRKAEEKGYTNDRDFGDCGQAVLSAIMELLEIEDELTYKAATLMAGGIGQTGITCGALIGGAMALGLKYGRARPDTERSHTQIAPIGIELVRWFEKEYGTTSCRELTGFDLTNEDELQKFMTSAVHEECFRRCGKVAGKVAEIISRRG